MTTLYDKDGNEVEALTPEEVETKEKEIREEEQATATKTAEEVAAKVKADAEAVVAANVQNATPDELQKNLDSANTELAKMQDKDYDWKALREQGKEKETVINELKGKIHDLTESLGTIKQDTTVEAVINKLAGGDEELNKKITLNFNRLGGITGKTEEQVEKDIRDAFLMASGSKAPNALPNVVSSGGAGGDVGGAPVEGDNKPAGPPLTEGQTSLASKFGLTGEDLKKHDHKTGQFKPAKIA